MTLEESTGDLAGRKIAFVGDGRNNVARSLMVGCAKMGVHFSVATPRSLFPDEQLITLCRPIADASGATIEITDDIAKGVLGADAVYTDVWASMGEEAKLAERIRLLRPFQVTEDLMRMTGRKESIFLHCLPAVKGNEVSFDVIEGERSRVWDEAENRKHTIKAVMLLTM